jgi:hypothetical protein
VQGGLRHMDLGSLNILDLGGGLDVEGVVHGLLVAVMVGFSLSGY